MTEDMDPRTKNDDDNGLLAAYLKYRRLLARAIARVVGPNEIEDIVQEAYVRSMQAARVRPIRHPSAFLLQTARNLALNHVRSAAHRLTDHVEDSAALDVFSATASMETEAESRERLLLFCRALREVPVQCRRVFILKKVYGLSQKEISAQLGITQSTVEKHVAKGLMLVTEYLESVEKRGRTAKDAPRRSRVGEGR